MEPKDTLAELNQQAVAALTALETISERLKNALANGADSIDHEMPAVLLALHCGPGGTFHTYTMAVSAALKASTPTQEVTA